jgi:hypothetical protein
MKTVEQIKTDILATNPSRIFTQNDEKIEMSDAEFAKAVQDRAEMEYAQQVHLEEVKQKQLAKISGYRKLGLEDSEIVAIMALTAEDAQALGL